MQIIPVVRIPTPSYGCNKIKIELKDATAYFFGEYFGDKENETIAFELVFSFLVGFIFTAEEQSSPFEGQFFEEVVEIKGSDWLNGLRTVPTAFKTEGFHHFSVFFQDYGKYDVIAKSVELRGKDFEKTG